MADVYDATLVGTGKGRAGGYAWVAPSGTADPGTGELSTDFVSLGYVTEDGLTRSTDVDTNDIRDWGANLIKRELTSFSETFSVTFLEAREDVLKVIYGDDNVDGSDAITIKHNGDFMKTEHAFVFDYYVGDEKVGRTFIPRGVISEQADLQRSATDTVEYEVTITALADTDGNTATEYIWTVA